MSSNIYALLVGIDNYPSSVSSLKGCVNDVIAVEEYLQGRVNSEGFQLHLRTLKNQEATRQAIIDSFQQHLCQASSNDVAFFYYSGHGSQEEAPPEFWHLEPDRLDETLVCWDSRTEGNWDLADKELAKLIAEVAAKQPHFIVIMDCCHSGSGTRDPLQETGVRRVPMDKRQRPLDSFICSPSEADKLLPSSRSLKTPTGWTLSNKRHILLAACRDNEEAKEYYGNSQSRGAFCFFLMETLKQVNGSLTYRDLFKRTNALVCSKVTAQSPQLEATNLGDLDQPFLGGAIADRTCYFTLSHHKNYGWVIDGGAVHGVRSRSGNETTQLALFPFFSAAVQLRDLTSAIATAEVTEVLPQLSKVNISNSENLTTDMTFKAVVTSLPMPPLGVWLAGDEQGVQKVRQALLAAEPENKPSLYVQEVTESEKVEFRVLAQNGQYLIARPADDRPLVEQISNYTPESAAQVVKRLEHIARWTNIAELASPPTSRIQPDAVKIEIYQAQEVITSPQIRLEYQLENNGKWKQPSFQVKLTNTSNELLYCALLDLTDRYAISAGFFAAGGVWLNPGAEAWVLGKKPVYASVPQQLWEQGITEFKDILKLIVSTAEFDATLLEQDELDLPRTRFVNRGTQGRKSTLNRLMNRVQTRNLGARPEEEELYDDWVTSQVTITTVRPLPATLVPQEGNGISLASGVTLQPHPGLQAQARLTTLTQSTRDLGNLIMPPILREDPNITQPFQFTTSRGTDPGLSALELSNINAKSIKTVTPQQPLKLLVDTQLKDGEHLLPIAYDGEFFLPLGLGQTKDGKTEITLERLPEPVSEGKRSLTGAIRIFFQKVVNEKLGLEFPYPILAAADVSPDETVRYETELETLKQRVAKANRIVLYIHGIIGDTQSMIPSLQRASAEVDGQQKTLNQLYDLVLTYDYESLNIPIEQHAIALGQRLAAVGLDPNHDKVLHIVAHSMGGLVARWFIEREGGNQIVSHLIMLGTPNAGSPWPNVQAWVTTTLAIGLNSLSTVAFPVKMLGSLMAALETIDITLDQMQPGSDFLKLLESSPDPGIPYTILAGNTSIIPAALDSARLKRLMQKLCTEAVALPFFGQPNDIAATVHSIKSVSVSRSPQPQIQEVGCDHLVYFSHQAGLAALSTALIQAQGQAKSRALVPTPVLQAVVNNTTASSPAKKAKKSQWLIGGVMGILATLTIICLLIWQQSKYIESSHQQEPSQTVLKLEK